MITSISNPRIKWVRALRDKRRKRDEVGLFVMEGRRLIRESLHSGLVPRLVLRTQHLDAESQGLISLLARRGVEVVAVSEAVMANCSDLESPPGLLAVLNQPRLPPPGQPDLVLLVDRLSDPGNLGTLLRTALAAGVQAVYLTPGTVDPFNPKVVRGAMGAHLYLPVYELDLGRIPLELEGVTIWLADAQGDTRYDQVDWRAPSAVAIGSEARGGSRTIRNLAHGTVRVPMQPGVESLNASAAAAVILFEALRQRGAA